MLCGITREKLHEEMISEDDRARTAGFDDYYVVSPVLADWGEGTFIRRESDAEGFAYRSDTKTCGSRA